MYDVIAETVRIEGTRILATLIRTVGDVQLAEDAVQDATLAALRAWPATGIPPEPRAWLTVTARRKAIDILRRERARADKERAGTELVELTQSALESPETVQDDLLRLIFTCCHPTLSPPTRVALALRTLCGLSPAAIADVMLTSEAATAKRLTRARQKIAAANIPYRVPPAAELADRLPAVCAVIHSLYTSGHAPATGEAAYDVDLCTEAIRLAELLHGLLPEQPMPSAVLALLLLTEARRPARLDAAGDVVTLDLQDRTLWDAAAISRGIALLNDSLERSGRQADPYQLQAAIAAEHARAPAYSITDWREIVRLYALLLSVAPTPAAKLAHAVATAEADGPSAGLALLEHQEGARTHAVRADLLARLQRYAEAIDELSNAEPATAAERRHHERRMQDFSRRSSCRGRC
ncbi:RNA polymerase sigma factor [Kribbella albertanoniae]|uniref:Sigma-70 family RNA polymerase sigma factor n=1 Tax=Kribbella albertanoniae TaxID=1266829 RepID=A0A4R4PPX3_9ACTN|nr:sigma-70 family RNA polymerase sigma factor [Kribbella albertanoniae]TDC24311.1 sigma-70 family RNA polymerase sigma factor [Kribbella albertanoniae]